MKSGRSLIERQGGRQSRRQNQGKKHICPCPTCVGRRPAAKQPNELTCSRPFCDLRFEILEIGEQRQALACYRL